MEMKMDYRPLTTNDVEAAAIIFSEAYFSDPLISFVLPNSRTRKRTVKKIFRVIGELSIKNHRVFGVGGPLQGVAYWQQPDQENLSISVKSIGKFIPLLFTSYLFSLYRVRKVIAEIDALHQKYAHQPHYDLDNLAVLPSWQGKGIASRLIRPFLEMADSQHVGIHGYRYAIE